MVALAPAAPELAGTEGVTQIAKDQARTAQAKARLRQSAKRVTAELVELSENTIILGHIHPRWLRAAVDQALSAGEIVDTDWIEQRRRRGP